ncbi:MAG TPA: ATP-binding protein [candidate division Zixibacteria bacterium]|nr:ATP-binding protein [candidate division Zixibacteria bacterium]
MSFLKFKLEKIEKDEARQKLFFVLGLRLLVFLALLGGLVAGAKVPAELVLPIIFYGLFSLGFLFPLGWKTPGAFSRSWMYFYTGQLILEVCLEGALLRYTGDFSSPFSALFVLSIISAAIIFRFSGTLLFATLAALVYTIALATSVAGDFHGPEVIFNFWSALFVSRSFFATYLLNLSVFFLIALTAGFVARRLTQKTEELARAARELRQVRLELEDVLHTMHSGVLTVDRLGKIVFVNRTAEEILGLSAEELVGRDSREALKAPELVERLFSALYFLKPEKRSEISIVSSKGRLIPLGISTALLGEKETGVRGVVAVFQDLTHAKSMEEKIKEQERLAAIGELSAGIAHEIRNPLASLSGSVEVLKNELILSEEQKTLFDLVQKETARLNSIITDFLFFARTTPPRLERLDAARAVRETVELLKSNPAYRFFDIELKLLAPNVWVQADEGHLRQILINLAVNGLEAMEKNLSDSPTGVSSGKKLLIACGYKARQAEDDPSPFVSVTDEGKGIPPNLHPKIFQPFFSTKKSGTGLGLPIVLRLVANLKGILDFSSEPNKGTTFLLFLQRPEVKKELPLPQLLKSFQ